MDIAPEHLEAEISLDGQADLVDDLARAARADRRAHDLTAALLAHDAHEAALTLLSLEDSAVVALKPRLCHIMPCHVMPCHVMPCDNVM